MFCLFWRTKIKRRIGIKRKGSGREQVVKEIKEEEATQ